MKNIFGLCMTLSAALSATFAQANQGFIELDWGGIETVQTQSGLLTISCGQRGGAIRPTSLGPFCNITQDRGNVGPFSATTYRVKSVMLTPYGGIASTSYISQQGYQRFADAEKAYEQAAADGLCSKGLSYNCTMESSQEQISFFTVQHWAVIVNLPQPDYTVKKSVKYVGSSDEKYEDVLRVLKEYRRLGICADPIQPAAGPVVGPQAPAAPAKLQAK